MNKRELKQMIMGLIEEANSVDKDIKLETLKMDLDHIIPPMGETTIENPEGYRLSEPNGEKLSAWYIPEKFLKDEDGSIEPSAMRAGKGFFIVVDETSGMKQTQHKDKLQLLTPDLQEVIKGNQDFFNHFTDPKPTIKVSSTHTKDVVSKLGEESQDSYTKGMSDEDKAVYDSEMSDAKESLYPSKDQGRADNYDEDDDYVPTDRAPWKKFVYQPKEGDKVYQILDANDGELWFAETAVNAQKAIKLMMAEYSGQPDFEIDMKVFHEQD